MEPVSAILAITGATIRTGSKLWEISGEWRDAPSDVRFLRDDLASTERFFYQIQQVVLPGICSADTGSPLVSLAELEQLVDQGIAMVRKLEAIVDRVTTVGAGIDGGGHPSADREGVAVKVGKAKRCLWIRYSRRVAKLRADLAIVRSSVCGWLILYNVLMTTEFRVTLGGSHDSGIADAVDESGKNVLASLDSHLRSMESRMLDAMEQQQKPKHPRCSRNGDAAPQTSKVGPAISHTSSLSPPTYQREAAIEAFPHRQAPLYTVKCHCTCHIPATISTTLARPRLLGLVALVYSSRGGRECANIECRDTCADAARSRASWEIRVFYRFPRWLARVSISAFFSTNLNGAPQMGLCVLNQRSDLEVWKTLGVGRLIQRGDVEGVKRMLREGRISVYDVYGEHMYTALHIAAARQQYDIVCLLLQAGADPFEKLGRCQSVTAIGLVFRYFVEGSLTKQIPNENALSSIMSLIDTYVEEGDFSPLHLAIMGVTRTSLSETLSRPEGATYMDSIDNSSGFAPLHLAAIRGDAAATLLLVQYGADVNIRTADGTTPLFYAARYSHYQVVDILLRAGADIDLGDQTGWKAVHGAMACRSEIFREMVSLLLSYGADIDAEDDRHNSPIFYAVRLGYGSEAVEFVLSKGGDIDHVNGCGSTAIFEAVDALNYEAAGVLLRHGCDVAVVNLDRRNLLHMLALGGDAEMIEIFYKERKRLRHMVSEAANMKDNNGETPLQLMDERGPSLGPDARGVFIRLLNSFDEPTGGGTGGDDGDVSEDEFFDTVEM